MNTQSAFRFEFNSVYDYSQSNMGDTPVWEKIVALAENEEDEPDFEILETGSNSNDRPLVIWVHPGDACEHDCDDQEIAEASFDLQQGMGNELIGFSECDLVVLHRVSSQYAFEAWHRVHPTYYTAMSQAMEGPGATHLYGDDLEKASAWIIGHMDLMGHPDILLTGAWSHPEHGCVAVVGQALHAASAPGVRLSRSSPSEPGDDSNIWQPETPVAKPKKRSP
jgi:hypothetical protein